MPGRPLPAPWCPALTGNVPILHDARHLSAITHAEHKHAHAVQQVAGGHHLRVTGRRGGANEPPPRLSI